MEEGKGNRSAPTWRAWVISVLIAIALSVTATLLLGGTNPFRLGGGCAGSCCSPAGK